MSLKRIQMVTTEEAKTDLIKRGVISQVFDFDSYLAEFGVSAGEEIPLGMVSSMANDLLQSKQHSPEWVSKEAAKAEVIRRGVVVHNKNAFTRYFNQIALTDRVPVDMLPQIAADVQQQQERYADKAQPAPLMKSALNGKPVRSSRNDSLITIGASWPERALDFEPDTAPIDSYEQAFSGKRGIESVYADALAIKLKGRREVPVPTGFVDILTDTEIIEVKYCLCWKHAVGQLQMYGLYYPLLSKRVHLFGVLVPEKLAAITSWCRQAAIIVTHED